MARELLEAIVSLPYHREMCDYYGYPADAALRSVLHQS